MHFVSINSISSTRNKLMDHPTIPMEKVRFWCRFLRPMVSQTKWKWNLCVYYEGRIQDSKSYHKAVAEAIGEDQWVEVWGECCCLWITMDPIKRSQWFDFAGTIKLSLSTFQLQQYISFSPWTMCLLRAISTETGRRGSQRQSHFTTDR